MQNHAATIPSVPLNDGREIPQLGYGVWQIDESETERCVSIALEAGYRHIDTARVYMNEAGVGAAIRASDVPRSEIFVTTKLWNTKHGASAARAACEESLERLGLAHVDLYLIHWPVPSRELYVETWETFVALREDGLARSIGVSNFLPEHLERIIEATGVTPSVNQVELHPYFPQRELKAVHTRLGIATEAWSPIGQGGELLEEPALARVADAHGVSPAQAVLRWHLQRGHIVFPKSQNPSRIRENIDVFDFELDGEQMATIDSLDRAQRLGPDPATFEP